MTEQDKKYLRTVAYMGRSHYFHKFFTIVVKDGSESNYALVETEEGEMREIPVMEMRFESVYERLQKLREV